VKRSGQGLEGKKAMGEGRGDKGWIKAREREYEGK
jgi:hypothetical protein